MLTASVEGVDGCRVEADSSPGPSETASAVRSYSFVVFGDACPARPRDSDSRVSP